MVTCGNPECNKLFTPKSHIHAFCSKKCRRAFRRNHKWGWLRQMCLSRDEDTCQECGATDCPLDCHHITPICMGGENELDNLVALCRPCHRAVHKSWRSWYGYKRQGAD